MILRPWRDGLALKARGVLRVTVRGDPAEYFNRRRSLRREVKKSQEKQNLPAKYWQFPASTRRSVAGWTFAGQPLPH